MTWVQRWASASISGSVVMALIRQTPVLTTGFPLLSMECWHRTKTSSTMLAIWTVSRENLIFLSCTSTDASMMLLTMSRSLVAQLWISCSGFCTLSSMPGVSVIELLRPMMPCRGDFSSWLTMAIKLDFFCSISLMLVMSWPTQITPTMSPCGLTRGVAFSSRHTGFWFECVDSDTSKFEDKLPLQASAKTLRTTERQSLLM
mmetsp:Transcript_75364/g.221007  ORF Transcript_75364/g.221007 Transcript_75364/m.221007 type:complete len:202 (+) Transcript_75364:2063-2668(+)